MVLYCYNVLLCLLSVYPIYPTISAKVPSVF